MKLQAVFRIVQGNTENRLCFLQAIDDRIVMREQLLGGQLDVPVSAEEDLQRLDEPSSAFAIGLLERDREPA
jgi:hypothetical protein